MKTRGIVVALFILGIALILSAPYIPDICFALVTKETNLENVYDQRYYDLRFEEVLPSFRMAGVVLSGWGIALYSKTR